MTSERIRQSFLVVLACALVSLAGTVAAPPFYPDKTHLLIYRTDDGTEHPVHDAADWSRRRAHILAGMQEVMGALPGEARRVPLDVHVTEEVQTAHYTRLKLTYAAEPGDRVPAYLLLPRGHPGKRPAMLCLHQTNGDLGKAGPVGLGGRESLFYGLHLVERGYVVLAPDYPSFGEYRYDFAASPYPSGSLKAVWNNLRAIDLLCARPEVDPQRIGCIGHSLGGHNALFTAVFDQRIRAVVSNCGFTSFPRYMGGNLKGWTSPRDMPRIAQVYHLKPDQMPFDFTEVIAAIAPRACLAVAPLHDDNFDVAGVREVLAAARPVFACLGAAAMLQDFYPDGGHDFLPESRRLAYDWLDRSLNRK